MRWGPSMPRGMLSPRRFTSVRCLGMVTGEHAARHTAVAAPRLKVSPCARTLRAPRLNPRAHLRQPQVQPGLARSRAALRRPRGGDRPRPSRGLRRQARETEVRSDPQAAGESAASVCEPASHSAGRQARGLEARSRPVHVRQRNRSSLRIAHTRRIRSHRPRRARRRVDGGEHTPAVPDSQSVRGRVRVRSRVHEPKARPGSACNRGP